MPRYHGIDWDAVERRLAEMEWLRSVYANDPNFELIGFEFIDGWPHEKLRARPTIAIGPRERFTANEYVMALRTDYAAHTPKFISIPAALAQEIRLPASAANGEKILNAAQQRSVASAFRSKVTVHNYAPGSERREAAK